MAFSSLTDQLALLGWTSSVALPGDVKRVMDAVQSQAWPAGEGVAAGEVKSAQTLPGFASLQLDPGLPVTVTLSAGFRADITIAGTGVTVPGLTGGTPRSSGAGRSLQRWVQPAGTPVKALLSAVLRLEGTPGSAATMRLMPNGHVPLDPPFMLLPGGAFGLHVPDGLVVDDGIAVEAELFLPRGVPYVGGTVAPVSFALGVPSGVKARAQVDVPAADGRPRIRGVVEWDDPGAVSLAACAPTSIDLSAEFDVDGALATPVGEVVVAAGRPLRLRARYARDIRQSPGTQQFDVTVVSDGPDGLIRVAVDDGLAGNVAARVFVTAAALADALLADTPASTAPSGDASSAGLVPLLGVAAMLSSFCKQGEVVVHGVTLIGTVGTPKLVLALDYSVDVLVKAIDFAGLGIGMQDDVPMRVRHRDVRLEIDPAADGLGKFHLSFDQASTDVEDPGRWRVPGAPFDVTGNRAGHGSTWFEIDLRFTLDLGPVKVSGATLRATFDGGPVPDVTLRGLDASLAVPGVIDGGGKLALVGNGFEAALGVRIVPLNLAATAQLKLLGQMIVLELAVDLPGAIPLGPTGLGLYSIGGAFGFNALPDLPPRDRDPVEFQLAWTPQQTHFSAGDLMFGFAAVVGTLPDQGFAFSAAGRILLTAPNFTFRAGLDAGFLGARRRLGDIDQPISPIPRQDQITGVLVYDGSGVLIGLRGSFDLKPLLEILVPIDAVFPGNSPDWRIHVGSDGADGRTPGPVRVRVLPDLLDLGAEAFLMVHGKDILDVGGRSDFDLHGFAVAFGAGFHAVCGAGIVWLELAADAQFGIGTSPLVVRGHGHLEGSLHLGPVSIGASADIDAQIGPGDARWAKFSVCGEVDLFFFEISGCVTITIGDEDKSVPEPGDWPLPEVTLCDHAYRRTGEAVQAGDPPFVWPDVIPVLGFPVLPGPAGFASAQFGKALLSGTTWKSTYPAVATSTGRTGADDLSYEFALTGLRLISADGTPVAGDLEAAWQQPKVTGGAASGGVAGELALLTWQTALWTSRLADGGKSLPHDPLEPEVGHCQVRPREAAGWALGAPAKPVGDGWRMPPEAGPGDPLVSRFWVDVDVTFREQPVRPTLLGMPGEVNFQPGGPIVFSAPLNGGGHDFGGALGLPGLVAPRYLAHELGLQYAAMTIVDDQVVPDVLVLLVDDFSADQVSATGWVPSYLPGTDGHTLVVLASNAGVLVSQIVLQYPVGARVAILGLHGLSKTARDNAAAAAAAAAAASKDEGLLLGKAKGDRRTLLEPGTTYGVEVTLACVGKRTDNGKDVATNNFGPKKATYWFRTPPIPPDPPPPPKGYRALGQTEAGATDPGHLAKRLVAQDKFEVSSLQRYLLGYTPTDRVANYYPDDPVGAHFSVDHVGALAMKYQHRISLVLQRTDLPPGSPPQPPAAIAAVLAELWADAKDQQLVVDQRKLELAVLSGCPVPLRGSTLGGPAGLVPGATYDLAVQVPKTGADLGIALPGVVFTTSRYRNPREQVSALGFAAPQNGATTGDLPTPSLDLTSVPATDGDTDSVLAVFLDQLGLGLWEPDPDGACTLLWSRPDAGPWRLGGVLLESPEPLERPGRLRLGALDCMSVPFDVVRRNATGTRVLYLTRTPVVPRRCRVGPITWLPPLLSLSVLEHPAATSPVAATTPPQTSFVLRAVVPTSPAFAEELS